MISIICFRYINELFMLIPSDNVLSFAMVLLGRSDPARSIIRNTFVVSRILRFVELLDESLITFVGQCSSRNVCDRDDLLFIAV